MKRLFFLLAIVLGVSACHKTETLVLIIANAYDQTVIVSGNGSETSIKSGQFQPIHLSGSGGFNNPLDVHAIWTSFFYDEYQTLTISSEDHTVLDTWTKDDPREGNPFDVGNWSHDQEVKIGLEGGLKEGGAYTFIVSGEDRTKYTLTYVLIPKE